MDQRDDYADRDVPPSGPSTLQRLAVVGLVVALAIGFVIWFISQLRFADGHYL